MRVKLTEILKDKILSKPIMSNTGFKGVTLRSNGKVECQFSIMGKKVHIGNFDTVDAARLARIEFIDKLK